MTVTFVDDRDDPPLSETTSEPELRVLADSLLASEGLDSATEVAISLIELSPQ